MSLLYNVCLLLTVVGGLNWGLVGGFKLNLVSKLFGEGSTVEKSVYILVGLSSVYLALFHLVGF